MKNLFSFKLYREGLKKCKLMGIGIAIASIVLSALYPIGVLLTQDRYNSVSDEFTSSIRVSAITSGVFIPACILLIIVTPLFFFTMFSFLTKRNESDFYHAIPFKRETVVISFSAAIYTWLWGTLLASLLLNGILWLFCTEYSYSFLLIPKLFGILAFGTLYIGGFALLGITLTGTHISASAIAIILLCLFRVAATFFTSLLETIIPYIDLSRSPLMLLSIRYWFPIALPAGLYINMSLFDNAALWIWSGIVAIAVNVLAVHFYRTRKSETASKSAPSKRLQHLYRCAFTLPFALLTVFAVILSRDFSDGITYGVILGLITLVVYYLYELITTKSIRSTLKCTPYLLAIVIVCVVFIGGLYCSAAIIRAESAEPEDIVEFGFYNGGDGLFDLDEYFREPAYEEIMTNEITVSSKEASKIISEAWKREKEGRQPINYDEYNGSWHILIKLPSGRTIGRYLMLKKEELSRLQTILSDSDTYKDALLRIPTEKEIQSIVLSYGSYGFTVNHSVWKTFREEYETLLTEEEKKQFKEGGYDSEFSTNIMLYGSGEAKSKSFNYEYFVPKKFTKTIALLRPMIEDEIKKQMDHLSELFADLRSGAYSDRAFYFDMYGYLSVKNKDGKENPDDDAPAGSFLNYSIYLDSSFDFNEEANKKLVDSLISWTENHLAVVDLLFTADENSVSISMSDYSANSFEYFSDLPLVEIDEKDFNELKTILKKFSDMGYSKYGSNDDFYDDYEYIYD